MNKSIRNARETQKLAAQLAKKLLLSTRYSLPASPKLQRGEHATVIGLVGDLGSGKTTFIQGFAKALGIKKHLTSPTFLIVRHYSLHITHYSSLYHIDTYRLKSAKDLLSLGLKEILRDQKNIVLIEWADKIKKILPSKTIWINFAHGYSPKERIIKVSHQPITNK